MGFRSVALVAVLLAASPAIMPDVSFGQSATRRNSTPAAQPFRYTPEEQEACLPDVQRLCDIMQKPPVIVACLRRQWDDVSEECRAVLERHRE